MAEQFKPYEAKATKLLIIDFYNLHLQSGPKYDKSIVSERQYQIYCESVIYNPGEPVETKFAYEKLEKELKVDRTYPNKDEQNRIMNFLERHIPEFSFNSSFEFHQASFWFESKYFLRFADDYHHIKQIIDEYMCREISSYELEWLDYRLGSLKRGLRLISESEEIGIFPRLDNRGFWNIENYKIDYLWTRFSKMDYGIITGTLVNRLIEGLADLLIKRWRIGRCQYNGCKNLFIIWPDGQPQRFCSNAHRMRVYRIRKKEKIPT